MHHVFCDIRPQWLNKCMIRSNIEACMGKKGHLNLNLKFVTLVLCVYGGSWFYDYKYKILISHYGKIYNLFSDCPILLFSTQL